MPGLAADEGLFESNIRRALSLGIPLRVGIVGVRDGQGFDEVMQSLADLDVTDGGVDYHL